MNAFQTLFLQINIEKNASLWKTNSFQGETPHLKRKMKMNEEWKL